MHVDANKSTARVATDYASVTRGDDNSTGTVDTEEMEGKEQLTNY